jgi:hypothetical protein
MRSLYITGTPAQVRQWNIYAFLAVNLVCGFFVVWFALDDWIKRVMWYKLTGGRAPIPEQIRTPRQLRTAMVWSVSLFVWCVIAFGLAILAAPEIWPVQRHSVRLFALILWAPLLPILVFKLSTDRPMRNRLQREWKTAGVAERILRAVALLWFVGFFLLVGLGDPAFVYWGFRLWFPIPPVMLTGLVVGLLLTFAWAMSIRRQ